MTKVPGTFDSYKATTMEKETIEIRRDADHVKARLQVLDSPMMKCRVIVDLIKALQGKETLDPAVADMAIHLLDQLKDKWWAEYASDPKAYNEGKKHAI